MIHKFFSFLKDKSIDFCLINGYEDIIAEINTESDIDILFKKDNFLKIEEYIKEFSLLHKIQIVQILHHDLWAKNIFLYNSLNGDFLNLDLYGELSRKGIIFFKEEEIFNSLRNYENIPILSIEKEFCNYLIKKLDKNDMSQFSFDHLKSLYLKDEVNCDKVLIEFFPLKNKIISDIFKNHNFKLIQNTRDEIILDFYSLNNFSIARKFLNIFRTVKRILDPTGLTISFLGPDGSGKSTIIDKVLENRMPFRRKDYFHLKPICNKQSLEKQVVVVDPHKHPPYSKLKSYIKLLYFIYQYNFGWIKNISKLKIKSSLIIFDRYFDDMLVDNRRYRYGGSLAVAKFVRYFIPKADLYFILTTDDAKIIYERKQEVSFEELERQILGYRALADGKQYFNIDVNATPDEIVKEITTIIMDKMNERY